MSRTVDKFKLLNIISILSSILVVFFTIWALNGRGTYLVLIVISVLFLVQSILHRSITMKEDESYNELYSGIFWISLIISLFSATWITRVIIIILIASHMYTVQKIQ